MNFQLTFLRLCFFLVLDALSILTVAAYPNFLEANTHNKNIQIPLPKPLISDTNITICNNQLPYFWNNITCIAAGTYTATLTNINGGDSIAVLHLFVINVGISITNAVICDNELPYIWNGQSYGASGTYSVTLTSSTGCDSVPILSLTINSFVSSITNKTICSNQLPFSWNGNSYTSAGTYPVTLTSTAGCDSIARLILSVKPVVTSTTNVTLCSNRLPYIWNGRTYNVAGLYTVLLIAANGCDSMASLQLKVNPVASSITRISVCSNQLPYNWNGLNITTAGTHPVTLTSYLNCDSIANLILLILPIKTSLTTINICNNQLPYLWNGNTYTASGRFAVPLTAANGCDSVATLQLTAAAFLSSTTNHTVCNANLPYSWNGNTYSSAGTYTSAFVTAIGCDSIATLYLEVIYPYAKTDSLLICADLLPYHYYGHVFTAAGNFAIVPPRLVDACQSIDSVNIVVQMIPPGTSIVKRCTNQLPYFWNGQGYSIAGNYSVTLTSAAGCDSVANLNFSVTPVFAKDTTIIICSNQAPLLWNGQLYSNSGTYIARLVSSTGCDSVLTLHLTIHPVKNSLIAIAICNAQVPFLWNGQTILTSGTYTDTLTSSAGCDSINTLRIFVQPFLTSTTNITVCNSQLPYQWNGNTYTAGGSFSINLLTAAGCDSVATLNLAINNIITSSTIVNTCSNVLPYRWNNNSYTASGIYSVTLLTGGGCDSVATLYLNVGVPDTTITNITICNNQLPFSWNNNVFPIAGVYPVTLTNVNGCDSVAILRLVVRAILTSTTNVNICTNQLPYLWSGNNYNSGGTYSVTLTTTAGCDSVPILSLTIVPYVTSTTSISICSNQLPYSWNGQTFTAPGTYSVLLSGSSVCDSLATLTLAVTLPFTSVTTINICANQLPYSWNGRIYNNAGTYTTTLNTSSGCDSIATLNLRVIISTSSTTTRTICSNELPYQWNGNTYLTSGTYQQILYGSNGCDSIATLKLFVNNVPTSFTPIVVCANQLPYLWNGNIFSSAGTFVVPLIATNGCDSLATIQLSVYIPDSSYTVITKCANQLPYNWNGQMYTQAGSYRVMLMASNGCDSIARLQLIVDSISISNTRVVICNNMLPYSWNGRGFAAAGTYTSILNNSKGCDSIATLQLIVQAVTNSNTSASTCINQLPYLWNGQQINASGNYTSILRNAAGCDSVAQLQLVVHPILSTTTFDSICSAQLPYLWNGQSYTTTGLYTVTLNSASGCDSMATLQLLVRTTPLAPTTSPISVCQYNPVPLAFAGITSAGSQLLWYNVATGGNGVGNAPILSSVVPGSITYYVSQLLGFCEGPRATLAVTIHPKPLLGADKNSKLCFGDSLYLPSLYNTSQFTTSWSFQQLPVSNNMAKKEGTYQMIAQSNYGCLDTSKVFLSILPAVFAYAGNDADAEYNAPYQLNGNGNAQFEWYPTQPLNNPQIANPTAILTADEIFILTVKNELGCLARDTVKLRVLKGPTFYVPSAFTPNGDGINDIFRPTAIGIASMEYFRIYNRYGQLVFETAAINQGWNGVYKGVKQNMGNYVWMLKGKDRFGDLKMMKGNVLLIK